MTSVRDRLNDPQNVYVLYQVRRTRDRTGTTRAALDAFPTAAEALAAKERREDPEMPKLPGRLVIIRK